MLDLNEQAKQAEERRANRVSALAGVQHLKLPSRRDALLDALLEVEATIKQGEESADALTAKPAAVVRVAPPATTKANGHSLPTEEGSPTEFIKALLLEVAPKNITAREMSDEAEKRKLGITNEQILQALTRMWNAAETILVRRGKPGKFRYGIKSQANGAAKTPQVAPMLGGPAPVDEMDGNSIAMRVLSLLKTQPTGDYGIMADKVLGVRSGDSRTAMRNACYYLAKIKKAVRRADGVWEAMPSS